MTKPNLTDQIKPYVDKLVKADKKGDRLASQVITLYNMYAQRPEQGSETLCRCTFEEWLKTQTERKK